MCGRDATKTTHFHEGFTVREEKPCIYLSQIDGGIILTWVTIGTVVVRRLRNGNTRMLDVANTRQLDDPNKVFSGDYKFGLDSIEARGKFKSL